MAALVDLLGSEDTRRRAIEELVALGPGLVPFLETVDMSADTEVRWALTQVRGRLGDMRLLPALVEITARDTSPPVRYEALRWVVALDHGKTVPDLLVPWLDSEEPMTRWGAAVALAAFSRPEGLEVLHAGVRSRDVWQRQEAINSLGRVHDQDTPRVLAPLIVSPVESDRREVVMALGQIGGAEAYLLLLGAMNDEESEVRWRACKALGDLGDPRAVVALHKLRSREHDPKVLKHAERALERLEAKLRTKREAL